ncbi:MAG TPA: KamA family radical SAM protein [candidate division Zixibacteria bacterium]|nr:KamA family radical SAM protein [candidate division Zixibacteria bacterium]
MTAHSTGAAEVHKTPEARKRAKYILNLDKVTQLSESERSRLKEVTKRYVFRANDYYLSLIDWDDPRDPIRQLVIPQERELEEWGKLDASNESAVTVQRGVQHKYGTTVLLLVNEACGAYCRYCFRKRLFMNDNDEVNYKIDGGLDYIRNHSVVDNVLLTGGDPMIIQTPKLDKIFTALREIDHVKIIRVGTKIPAFNPYRFINDPELMDVLRKHSHNDRRIYFMCHFDHPNELTDVALQGLRMIQEAGVICVNQNPIIRGISDDPDVMAELWNRLSYVGVPQYYIFQGRPTEGNEPYEVPIAEAYFKIEEAKKKCSGLAKRLKYAMSHESGKVEIVGVDAKHIYLKYHRAKFASDEQRMIVCYRDDDAYWLDQLRPLPGYRNDYYTLKSKSAAQGLDDRRHDSLSVYN